MKLNIFLILVILFCKQTYCQDSLSKAIRNKYGICNKTFDYIVVGVGNAGAVVAKTLSDDKQTSVLAMHLGPNLNNNPLIKFSKNARLTVFGALFGSSVLYQTGFTTPQINADDVARLWVLARPEAGASSINAGAFCRETNQINEQWQAIAGPLWSVNRITNLYKQLETYQGETTNPDVRGFGGPINIRQVSPSQVTKIAQTFTQAVIQATGFPFVLDYNDPNTPIGVSSQFQYTQSGKNGVLRVSSATAFLNQNVVNEDGMGVNGRKLQIALEATALRVIWQGKKAIGVEYTQNGYTNKVFARKGVIVSAGLMSSKFLMYSGVGPKTLLESFNIKVKFDNPNVGQGLADQPRVTLLFSSEPSDTPPNNLNSSNIFSQISWLPDPTGDQTIRALRLSTINLIPGLVVGAFDLCQPLSRGSITINSSNPLAKPIINLGIFSNSSDLQLYIRGFQTYIKNINIALQTMNPQYKLILPDPAIIDDEAELTEFIKGNVASNQHFQSHCKMAPLSQGGVVNSKGRVYGVQNLYVADDSIVPLCMDGSPMASAYLMAYNVSKIIQNK